MFSQAFRWKLKRLLNERTGLVIMRGQIVLDMDKLPQLTSRNYIRVCSLDLVAKEVQANGAAGSVAELGVYQGEFARSIHSAFPERKLYLFDTFEGFSGKDKKVDVDSGFSAATEDFSNTTIDAVVNSMTYKENVIVRAGYFPDSIQEADRSETFAFVSIDTDLYKPTYEGLQFFYPRLSRGGYIFLHDYNSKDYQGVKAAVQQYCREQHIGYCPMVDPCGTAVISKG